MSFVTVLQDSLLRRQQVQARTGLARSTLYALIRSGEFPASVSLTGGRAVAWRASDVDRWIASRTVSKAA
jgi:prophage regulatory protein